MGLGEKTRIHLKKHAPWDYVNFRALAAGICLVVSLVLVSRYMSQNVQSTPGIGPYKTILGILFIGLSTGFYVGKSIGDEGGPINSFLIGFFGSLSILVIFSVEVSLLNMILVFIAATSFLMYNSGLVKSHEDIERWIGILIQLSLYGLLLLGLLHYVVPIASVVLMDVVTYLIDNPVWVVFIVISLVAAIIAVHATIGWDQVYEDVRDFIARRLHRFY